MSAGQTTEPRLDQYKSHLQSAFTVYAEGVTEPIELILTEAAPKGPGERPFSLIFDGPPHIHLPQGLYSLAHRELGSLYLFLVPVSGDSVSRKYQAVFN